MPEVNETAMKAAEPISEKAMQAMVEIGHIMPASITADATTRELRQLFAAGVAIIDRTTNLTAKEGALREMIELLEAIIAQKDPWATSVTISGAGMQTLALAKKAMEL